ncbi:MAG: SDR family oxidoreductase [Thermoguttaceae bacterium]|nr:SDR family oxidoreductase [Thermoguttaceae bacterium]MDW8077494.1 SDR family oxidoreductase [Thermoguttaceae bacterium]
MGEGFSAARRVALVTGAGRRRVGNVVARAFAHRGYAVAIHYRGSVTEARETVDELQAAGCQAVAIQADVSVEADVVRMVREVQDHFGRIDVLVTSAAIWEPKPLEELAADDLLRHLAVNLVGTFLCCLHVGRVMVRQPEGGAIITIGDWAIERPYQHYAAYFASKGAIPTITRTFAVELAARNPRVRVNSILPGPVMLPPDLDQTERAEAIAGTLLRREGSPEHVAEAAIFLAEHEYITGVCLPVDGGRTVAPFTRKG